MILSRTEMKTATTQEKTPRLIYRVMMMGFAAMLALAAVPAKAHESFSELAAALTPSVVNISTTMVVDGQGNNFPTFPEGSPFEDFLEEFRDRGGQRRSQALGSGFIVDKSGIIVTNNHVIESR